jgi:iron complex transport system substrate-binding protein
VRTVKLEKDRVVGVGSWCQKGSYKIFFPEYQDTPVVSSSDPESILKLDPDLVLLMVGSYSDPAQKVLEAAGITVFRAHGGVWDGDAGEEAIRFGYIFDKEKEAEEFRDWYESSSSINLIKERVEKIPEEDKPKVYLETTKYSVREERCTHIARTGGKNIFEGMSGKVDPEAVVKRNPDIIVKYVFGKKDNGYDVDVGDIAKLKEVRDEIMSRPELQTVTAVKEGRVYILSGYIISWRGTAGCRCFLQDIYQATWFHPELFEDIDPKPIHQEYLARFQGLDIDLDEKGVFVYHPEEHPDGH